jgi:phytoene synthase
MHAYAIYGFCRWADNGVDDARDASEAAAKVDQARRVLDRVYDDKDVPQGLEPFRRTVHDRAIPRGLFDSLLDGMAMDLTTTRYADFAALDLYCYRVAGVVGLMMTHVFGFADERCLPRALALGTAMQLTNILRDVAEDWSKGRLYLPQDELDAAGISESQIAEGRCDDRFRDFMRGQIGRARRYYAEAEAGVPDLRGASSRLTVRVMGRLYGGILGAIERLDYDVFKARAHVPTHQKLATLASCLAETGRDHLNAAWV